jgi:hypothetical protein
MSEDRAAGAPASGIAAELAARVGRRGGPQDRIRDRLLYRRRPQRADLDGGCAEARAAPGSARPGVAVAAERANRPTHERAVATVEALDFS